MPTRTKEYWPVKRYEVEHSNPMEGTQAGTGLQKLGKRYTIQLPAEHVNVTQSLILQLSECNDGMQINSGGRKVETHRIGLLEYEVLLEDLAPAMEGGVEIQLEGESATLVTAYTPSPPPGMDIGKLYRKRMKQAADSYETSKDFPAARQRCQKTFFLLDLVFMFRTIHPNEDEASRSLRLKTVLENEGIQPPPILTAMMNSIRPNEVEIVQNKLAGRVSQRRTSWKSDDFWPQLPAHSDWFGDSISGDLQEQKLAVLGNCLAEVFLSFHENLRAEDGQPTVSFRPLRRSILLFASGMARIDTTSDFSSGSGMHASEIMNAEPNGTAFLVFAEFGHLLLSTLPSGLTDQSRRVWENVLPALILGIDSFTRCYGGFSARATGAGPLRMCGPSVLQEQLAGGRDPRPLPITIERMLDFIEVDHRAKAPGATPEFYPYLNFYPLWGFLLAKQLMHLHY
ncbi:MAG: hypothetical protein ACI87O_000616 [Planctomycetota bacterium]|jgi:hypothetical protein